MYTILTNRVKRFAKSTYRVHLVLAILCALAGLTGAWLHYSPSDAASNSEEGSHIPLGKRLNIVLIVVDTLRADYLSLYGYPIQTSSFVDTLGLSGLVFDEAYSASSWTAPSTASIFTSLYPREHGVIMGYLATLGLQKKNRSIKLNSLPKSLTTLPMYLRRHGYETIGVADNLNIGHAMGFDRGFRHFRQFRYEGAPKVVDQVATFMDQRDGVNPYFLYLHFMDPHEPYHAREPFYSECLKLFGEKKQSKIRCRYASEVNYVDGYIQQLSDRYDWMSDNTVVFLTSDHGEEFWEHGKNGHGHTLFRELVHIPMIMKIPGCRQGRIQAEVGSIDLFPTVAGILQGDRDLLWQGRDLHGFCSSDAVWKEPRLLMSERLRRDESVKPSLRGLVHGPWHYIETQRDRNTMTQYLFDIQNDKAEIYNLAKKREHIASHYALMLNQTLLFPLAAPSVNKIVELDDDTFESLKTLGYIN